MFWVLVLLSRMWHTVLWCFLWTVFVFRSLNVVKEQVVTKCEVNSGLTTTLTHSFSGNAKCLIVLLRIVTTCNISYKVSQQRTCFGWSASSEGKKVMSQTSWKVCKGCCGFTVSVRWSVIFSLFYGIVCLYYFPTSHGNISGLFVYACLCAFWVVPVWSSFPANF